MGSFAGDRLSSTILPWCTEYDVSELPDYAAIRDALKFAGDLARACAARNQSPWQLKCRYLFF